jgi:hypothetical protein
MNIEQEDEMCDETMLIGVTTVGNPPLTPPRRGTKNGELTEG